MSDIVSIVIRKTAPPRRRDDFGLEKIDTQLADIVNIANFVLYIAQLFEIQKNVENHLELRYFGHHALTSSFTKFKFLQGKNSFLLQL